MSGEAFGRHEAIRLVNDLDIPFHIKHEAVSYTVVHDAQEECGAGTYIYRGFIVVLVDG